MCEVPFVVRRGEFIPVLFDEEDVDWVQQLPARRLTGSGKQLYASCVVTIEGTIRRHLLSRLVAGLFPGDVREADHIDGNTLDNRRANLRIVSRAFQQTNLRPRGSDRAMGVVWYESRRRWMVSVQVCGRRVYGGSFKQHDAAASAASRIRNSMIEDAVTWGLLDRPEPVPTLAENVKLAEFLSTIPRGHWASRRTHCRNGHPFDSVNSYVHDGVRICRACRYARTQRYLNRKHVVVGGTNG